MSRMQEIRVAHTEGAHEFLATKADALLCKKDLDRAISSLMKWFLRIAVALLIPVYGALIIIIVLLISR